jgi:uncharacterized protein YkwD
LRPSWKRADRPLIALACALVALLPGAASAEAATAGDAGGFTRAMLRELNRVRAGHRLSAVREDRPMDRGALGHSRDMARRGYFAHGSWTGRVMAAAGSARSVGEVIGWRVQGSAASEASNMVREWLGSPPHRQVLLSGGFTRVGIGRAIASTSDGRPSALYTVDFAG